MSDHFRTIVFKKKDRWANITLNRPEVKNALSEIMTDELMLVFKEIKEDDSDASSDDIKQVQPDFELIAFDFVSNPSTHGAFMAPANEGKINESVGTRDGVCCHDCKVENIIDEIIRG